MSAALWVFILTTYSGTVAVSMQSQAACYAAAREAWRAHARNTSLCVNTETGFIIYGEKIK